MAAEPEVSFVSLVDTDGTRVYNEFLCKNREATKEEKEACEKEPKTIAEVKAHEEEVVTIKEKCSGSAEAPTAAANNLCIYSLDEANFGKYLYAGGYSRRLYI